MASRWRLTLPIGVLAAVAVLAFPASGSALSAVFIQLTPTGPSPASLSISAGLYPVWANSDSAAHTVVFANGLCTLHVGPGAVAQCPAGFSVGTFAYTVDGTAAGSITVTPESRSVTLGARSHVIRHGARLILHGLLNYAEQGPPRVVGSSTTSMRVTILARPDRRHPFHAVASVRPSTLRAKGYPWQRIIRPRRTTIYVVRTIHDTSWQPAQSKPFKVVVRR